MKDVIFQARVIYRNKATEQIESKSPEALGNHIREVKSLYDVVEVKLKYFFDMGDGLAIEM